MQGPPELSVVPQIKRMEPGGDVTILVYCQDPPWFLSKGQVVAQAVSVPKDFPRCHRTPSIWWAEIVGQDKPTINCRLCSGRSMATLTGMVDTGADVTVVSSAEWPKDWGLKPVNGRVTRIGGLAASMWSANSIVIEGQDGHIATV